MTAGERAVPTAADVFDLTGRVAIVTGGGTGIGAATALLLAAHGADVVIAARTVDDLERTAASVEEATGRGCLPLEDLPTRAWDSVFDLNARAAYVATREVGRHFLAQGSGAIVNISSDAGVHGVRGGAHYASAKAALQMFTTVTAAEWGRYGVRVNCVAVGAIASERVRAAWRVAGIDEGQLAAAIPLGRSGRPDDHGWSRASVAGAYPGWRGRRSRPRN